MQGADHGVSTDWLAAGPRGGKNPRPAASRPPLTAWLLDFLKEKFGLFVDFSEMAYRVGLRAQANFSASTFELAHEAPALGNALLFWFSQLQLQCGTLKSGPQVSSPRSELSAKRAAKTIIDFC